MTTTPPGTDPARRQRRPGRIIDGPCQPIDQVLHTEDGRPVALRQVGWLGHARRPELPASLGSLLGGRVYELGDDPTLTELGGFSRLWVEVEFEATPTPE